MTLPHVTTDPYCLCDVCEATRPRDIKRAAAIGWITNDRVIATRLLTIEELHADARFAASNLPLKKKLAAYRAADAKRAADYARILEEIGA